MFNVISISLEINNNHLSKLNGNFNSTENTNELTINNLIAWDEIEIENEPEANNDEIENNPLVKSKLYAPLVCSPSIQTILYDLCQQLTKNLSYNMIE